MSGTTATRIKALLKKQTDRSFPVPSPYAYNEDYIAFTKSNDLPINVGTITTWCMYGSMSALLTGKDLTPTITIGDKAIPCGAPWDPKWPTTVINVGSFETASMLSADGFAKAGTYLLDLVGANQVSSLDDRNIESYFKAAGVEMNIATIKKSLPFFSSALDNLTSDPDFVGRSKKFEWLRYHITYASGNGLVMKFLEATGTTTSSEGPFKIQPAIVNLVKDAVEKPWDKEASDKVPMTLKGITHVYLEAIGMLPSAKWYQGEKGRANLTVAAVAAIRAYATRVTALKANIESITSATSIADANASLAMTGAVPNVV